MPGLNLLPDLEPEKYYQPKKWTTKHRQCVALHLAGWSNNEIAEALDWTPAKVSMTVNDHRAEHEKDNALAPLTEIPISVTTKLEEASHEAFEAVMEVLRDAVKDDTRLKAAFGLLDRAGFTPIRREIKMEADIPVDEQVVERMRQTLLESKNISANYKVKLSEAQEAEYEILDQAVGE